MLKRRLIYTLTLFIVSLMLLIGSSAWFILSFFPRSIEDSFEKIYKTQAQSVGEQIGAQFFERYGDIQAMAEATSLLMDVPHSTQKIEDLLNSYARLYRLYDLILVVDLQGRIIGANSKDITSKELKKPIYSPTEIKKSDWFLNPLGGNFTNDPGKGLQGTYFSLQERHSQIDNSKSLHSLFSALIYIDSNPVGVIVSYSRLTWLNQVVQEQYRRFLKLGMRATALRVIDGNGKVLTSYGSGFGDNKQAQTDHDFIVEEPVESERFPTGLDWHVQINSPRSDVRQLIQYSKFYYVFFAAFFFAALSIVTVYFGRQLKDLSEERAVAIAEQARLENQIRKQTHVLEQNLNELKTMQQRVAEQEKMAGLGIMATGLAHEIKNPLNVVINSSQYLIDFYTENRIKGDATEAKRFAEMIVRQSERIDALVKAILLSARKDAAENRVKVNVNDLVKECLQISAKSFQLQYHVTVPFELASQATSANVVVDMEDLRRAILNLIDNSLYSLFKKFGPENISKALLKLTILKQDSFVILCIEDNGLGISEEDAKSIFTPFFTTKEPGKGTGLGLSMSADLMKKYGGSIYFESEKNIFCRFFIKLPSNE